MKRVILVRTKGPRNAGLAARAVENFGPGELCFVAPPDESMFESCEYYSMAHGVAERRTRFPIVATLRDALGDVTDSYGFTARMRRNRAMRTLDEAADEIAQRAGDDTRRVALVFGNEEDGLSGDEQAPLHHLVCIPSSPRQPSINLGAAVSIVLAAIFREPPARQASRRHRPLEGLAREQLIAHLERALLPCVQGDTSRRDLERSLRRVFERAPLETKDARAWHRLARAMLGESGATRR
jgi:TrmH family RNA methyltransferase